MPTRAMRACSLSPECSLSYAKIMQGECNGKVVRQSLTKLDTAETQLILCKINNIAHVITIYLTKITYYKLSP